MESADEKPAVEPAVEPTCEPAVDPSSIKGDDWLHGGALIPLIPDGADKAAPAEAESLAAHLRESVRQREREQRHRVSEMVKTTVAFVMFLSPGVATSFYVVMVGYYQNKFHAPVFFMAMLLAVYGPYPVVAFAQPSIDSYSDRHTTRSTYPDRIVFSQSLLLTLTLIWMFAVPSMKSVVFLGILLGFASAIASTSGHQLISAIDPKKLIHAEIGNQMGQALPLLVFHVASFQPTATDDEFRRVLCTIIVVCILSISVLGAIHFLTVSEHAYLDLSLNVLEPSQPDPSDEGAQARPARARGTKSMDARLSPPDQPDLSDGGELASSARQVSDKARGTKSLDAPASPPGPQDASDRGSEQAGGPESLDAPAKLVDQQAAPSPREVGPEACPSASQGGESIQAKAHRSTPRWVYIWMTTKMLMTALQTSVMSLAVYFGGPSHTQFLVCAKLMAEFFGRMVALPVCQLSTAPWHRFLAMTVAIRVVFALCLLAQLRRTWLSSEVFAFMWSAFAFLDRFAMTLVDVTAGANVELRDRKLVSRVTFAFGFAGLLLGLAIALFVVLPLTGVGSEQPSSLVESQGQEAPLGVSAGVAALLQETPRNTRRFAVAAEVAALLQETPRFARRFAKAAGSAMLEPR